MTDKRFNECECVIIQLELAKIALKGGYGTQHRLDDAQAEMDRMAAGLMSRLVESHRGFMFGLENDLQEGANEQV